MPTVSDLIAIELNLDTGGLQKGIEGALQDMERASHALTKEGSDIERIAKSVGYALEKAVHGVAGFFGLILSFEGFKALMADASNAGTSMGRFAESISKTVESTQAYKQAFSAFTGGETGILQTIRKMKLDISAFPLVYTDWMRAVEGFTFKTTKGKEPEEILHDIAVEAARRHMSAAQLNARLQGTLPLTDADLLLLSKPGELEKALEEQKSKVGTPTTPQTKAMERLSADLTNLETLAELLKLQTLTWMEPFLHKLITLTIDLINWVSGIKRFVDDLPESHGKGKPGGVLGEATSELETELARRREERRVRSEGREGVPPGASVPSVLSTGVTHRTRFNPTTGKFETTSQTPVSIESKSDDASWIMAHGGHPAGTNPPQLNPEFAARLRAAGEAYESETGQKATFGEMGRGLDLQNQYYQEYLRNPTGGLAAPPGRSRHGLAAGAEATDIPQGNFQNWIHRNAGRFGLEGIGASDLPHIQLDRTVPGPLYRTSVSPVTPATAGGDVSKAIHEAARASGISEKVLGGIASVESDLDPMSNWNKGTQYKGLFQLNQGEFTPHGGGNIYSAHDNAMAAAKLLKDHISEFRSRFGRDPTVHELYMIHQQGLGFYTQGTMTNIQGNRYPGMGGPQTPETFEAGWGRELDRRIDRYLRTHPELSSGPYAASQEAPTNKVIGSTRSLHNFEEDLRKMGLVSPITEKGPAAINAQSFEDARPKVENNESSTNVNQVIVHTHATDASGIAQDVKDAIGKQMAPASDEK